MLDEVEKRSAPAKSVKSTPSPPAAAAPGPAAASAVIRRDADASEPDRSIQLAPEPAETPPETPPAASPAAPSPPPPKAFAVDHEHETLSRVLRVCTGGPCGESFPVELEDGETALRLDMLDRVIVERITAPAETLPPGEPAGLVYLLQCLRRCADERRRVPREDAERIAVLQSIRSALGAFCGTYLLTPDAFALPPGHAPEGPAALVPRIRAAAAGRGGRALPEGALEAIAGELSEADLDALLAPTVRAAAAQLRSAGPTLAAAWQEPLAVLAYLTRAKATAASLARLAWPGRARAAGLSGREAEETTVFGVLLSVSAAPDTRGMAEAARSYFPDPANTASPAVHSAFDAIQASLRGYRSAVAAIITACLKASPEARERVLDFLAAAAEKNAKWAAMAPDRGRLATSGFTLNAAALLVELAGPVVEAAPAPGAPEAAWAGLQARLDPHYFHEARRVDAAADTKLAVESRELDHWVDQRNAARQLTWKNKRAEVDGAGEAAGGEGPGGRRDFAFATEVVMLASRAIRSGPAALLRELQEIERGLPRALDAARAAEAPGARDDGAARVRAEALGRARLLYHALLTEPAAAAAAGRYFGCVAGWAARLADPGLAGGPGGVPEEAPMAWAALPEHLLDDLFGLLAFYAAALPDPRPALEPATLHHVVTLALYGIGNGKYVRNPYLRAKMAELLAELMRPRRAAGPGGLLAGERALLTVEALEGFPAARSHLVLACLALWVDAESTGSHTQFYDKFAIRRNLAAVLQRAWRSPVFAASLRSALESQPYAVARFTNMLVNDCTFALDESMRLLAAIRRHELNRRAPGYGALDAEERRAQEDAYETNQQWARSELHFAENNLEMVQGLAEHLPAALLGPEMCPRFAAMLNDLVNRLAGPQCVELKVEDPERLRWSPKLLLSRVLQVVLRAAEREAFVEAAVRDERSFSVPVLRRAGALARRLGLLLPEELAAWGRYEAACHAAHARARAEDEAFEGAPEELCDPLLGTLMREPVRLPCGQVCDRAVITRHLLSEETCPFTRARLTVAMLEPDEPLRQRAAAFVAERRAAARPAAP